jgi:hypothetical protein
VDVLLFGIVFIDENRILSIYVNMRNRLRIQCSDCEIIYYLHRHTDNDLSVGWVSSPCLVFRASVATERFFSASFATFHRGWSLI